MDFWGPEDIDDQTLEEICQLMEECEEYVYDIDDDILNQVYDEFERQQVAGGLLKKYTNIEIVTRHVIRQNDRFKTKIITYEMKLRDPEEVTLEAGVKRMINSLQDMVNLVMETENIGGRDWLGLEINGGDLTQPVILPLRANQSAEQRISQFKDEITKIQQSKKEWIIKSHVTMKVIVTKGIRGNGRMRQSQTLSNDQVQQLIDNEYLFAPKDTNSLADDLISGLSKLTNQGKEKIRDKLKWRKGISWQELLTFLQDDPELDHPVLVIKNETDGDRKIFMSQDWRNAYVFYLWQERMLTVIRPERLYSNNKRATFCYRCGHGYRKNRKSPHTCNEVGRIPGYKAGRKRAHYQVTNEEKQNKRSKITCNITNNCLGRAILTGLQEGTIPDETRLKEFYTLHHLTPYWNEECGYEELRDFQQQLKSTVIIKIYDEISRCVVFNGAHHLGIKPNGLPCIYINYIHNHFEYISSMSGWLGSVYYCTECEKGYHSKGKHRCTHPCLRCKSSEDHYSSRQPYNQECELCHRVFWNKMCFQYHRTVHQQTETASYSTCNRYQRCINCMVTVDLWNKEKKEIGTLKNTHKCYHNFCKYCKKNVDQRTHQCYIQTIPNETTEEAFHYCFFDFETRCLEESHTVNKVVAIKCCQACHKESDLSIPCQNGQCGRKRLHIFNNIESFCQWVLSDPLHTMYVFIAHNFKGYDSYPILEWMINQTYRPSCLFEGAKIIQMTVNKLTFKDSYCFIPVALRKFSKTFGVQEFKGFFPHFLNTLENQNYVGPYPDKHYYGVDYMQDDEEKKECEQWLKDKQEKGEVFDFQLELEKYCLQDTRLLMMGCLRFRSLYFTLFNVEPFHDCSTIAHLCLTIFKKNFLKQNTVGMVPSLGYRRRDIASAEGLEWLCALQLDSPALNLRTALHPDGEMVIDNGKVDGFDEENKVVYQYHGCFWHGCEICYKDRSKMHSIEKVSMGDLFAKTCKRTRRLKELGYQVVEKWSHEWETEREQYLPFLDRSVLEARRPILPRAALFGGRTNATSLYGITKESAKTKETNDPMVDRVDPVHRIRYIDVVSLYPTVMWYDQFPLGHPQIFCGTSPELQEIQKVYDGTWFGLVKCTVIPPRGLYFPVLPQVFHSKLMFVLCRTCTEELNQSESCHHTDKQRCLTGVWTTPELTEAVKQGYIVTKVHEVWHYENHNRNLFRDYIKENLRLKIQASGWPSDSMTEDEKDEMIASVFRDYGIQITKEDVKANPGLRAIAKLDLNCLWGKLGQNPFKSVTEYVTDPARYFALLNDSTAETINVLLFENNEDIVQVRYKLMNDAIEDNPNGNVVIAAFVTSWARLRLYQVLSKLNERVLYHDTDSVIYTTADSDEEEISTGSLLGMWSDECKDPNTNWIQEFVSLGPKTYAYLTKKGDQVVKCKGMTFIPKTKELLNMSSMLKLLTGDEDEVCVEYDKKIVRDVKEKKLRTVSMEKRVQFAYNKRRLLDDGISTLPYGY